jgi:hypothetical protein
MQMMQSDGNECAQLTCRMGFGLLTNASHVREQKRAVRMPQILSTLSLQEIPCRIVLGFANLMMGGMQNTNTLFPSNLSPDPTTQRNSLFNGFQQNTVSD